MILEKLSKLSIIEKIGIILMHFLFLITLFLCDMTYICICNSYCKGDSGAMPRIVAHDGDDIYRRYLCAYCTGRLMAWWRDIGAHCTRTLRMRRTEWNGTERNGMERDGTEWNGTERNETKWKTGTRCRVSYVAFACVANIIRDSSIKCFSARIYLYIVLLLRFSF